MTDYPTVTMLAVVLDGIGIYGTVMHYALIIASSSSALLAFAYCWKRGRLDLDEEPKQQMMKECDDSRPNHK
jgi:hypothetical protein